MIHLSMRRVIFCAFLLCVRFVLRYVANSNEISISDDNVVPTKFKPNTGHNISDEKNLNSTLFCHVFIQVTVFALN